MYAAQSWCRPCPPTRGQHQLYGRAKLETERIALDLGMAVVRLGLVYGPGWGGMAGSLKKMANLPVVPIVGTKSYQYTVHEEDLADAFVVLAHASKLPNIPLGLANPEPVPFGLLMERIAAAAGRPRSASSLFRGDLCTQRCGWASGPR